MLKRLMVVICVVVAADLLRLAVLSCFVGWRLPLVQTVITTVLGLVVIAVWWLRWAKPVAENDIHGFHFRWS